MSLIDIKKKELSDRAAELVYDGDPSEYDFKRATFILSLLRGIKPFLDRHRRSFDNLLIAQHGDRRFLFTSNGDPEIVLYYSYSSYGFKEYLYLGWTKVKARDFAKLPPEKQDELLRDGSNLDPWKLWKGERSLNLIAHALSKLSSDQVNSMISDKLGDSLVKHAANIYVTHDALDDLGKFVKTMKGLGTVQSKDLVKRMLAAFKHGVIKRILISIKEFGGTSIDVEKQIPLLRSKGANWTELDAIERSINATKAAKKSKRVNESADWHEKIVSDLLKDAERELMHNLPDGNFWTIGKVIQDLTSAGLSDDVIASLMSRYRRDIETQQDWLLGQDLAGVQAGLSNTAQLISIGIDWPELRSLIEKNKHSIMYSTLWEIANSNEHMYVNDGLPILYGDLVKIGVAWPEMNIINRSLKG